MNLLMFMKYKAPNGPKTCRQIRGPYAPFRLPQPKTVGLSAKEMVHPNPRGHPSGLPVATAERRASERQDWHREEMCEVPERNTPISQVSQSA